MAVTFSWVQNSADRKPDFDVTGVNAGDVVTIQIAKKLSFTGKWLYAYSVAITDALAIDFPEMGLNPGTWYARMRVNGGTWGSPITMSIA
jgi:hypothetical protein